MTGVTRYYVHIDPYAPEPNVGLSESADGNLMYHHEHLRVVADLEGRLAECYRLAGADPDGNSDAMLACRAVEAVRELRKDYEDACDLMELADKRKREAEAGIAEAKGDACRLRQSLAAAFRELDNADELRARAEESARRLRGLPRKWRAEAMNIAGTAWNSPNGHSDGARQSTLLNCAAAIEQALAFGQGARDE